VQRIFRCEKCQRGMRVVGSTGLGKEIERVAICPYCKTKNKVMWPKGDKFNVQRIATS
jgi:Zn finger protein HypA/HybF involved in hydrogenase expression